MSYPRASWLIVFCTVVVLGLSTAWFMRMSMVIVDEEQARVRSQLQEFVHVGMGVISPLLKDLEAGKITRQQAIDRLSDLMNNIKFDSHAHPGSHYIFAGSMDGKILSHPKYGNKQTNKAYLPVVESTVLALAEFAKENPNGGFVTYPFPKQRDGAGHKFAYILPVPELGIFIGSSIWTSEFRQMDSGFMVRGVLVAVILMILVVLPSFLALRELEKRNKALAEEVENRALAEEALRHSEEQHRMAMASSSDGLLDWDIREQEVFLSPRLFALLGRRPDTYNLDFEELVSMMHPDDVEGFAQVREDFRSGKTKSHEGEYRLQHQDGSWHWFYTTARVFATNIAGKSLRVVGAFSDITEKKKNEFERRRLASQLRRTQKLEAVGTLAGGIAHEFNNILTVILGFSQVALRKIKLGGVPEKELGEVIDASTRARDLVKQLLTFSRQQSTDKTELDIRPLVKESVRFMRSSLPSPVELEYTISSDPLIVLANSGSIHQLLINLINNAAQAMPKGGRLSVHLETTMDPLSLDAVSDSSNGCVRLLVEDEGDGLDSSITDRIFDPFFTTRGIGGGSGLGLSVVDGIVREHGGVIWGRNKSGEKGAVFEVLLPLAQPAVAHDVDKVEPVITGQGNLILVEDDSEVLEVSQAMLEGLGYHVATFTEAEKAMDAFQRNPGGVDMLVTDFEMPVMSGLELIRKVQYIKPELPALVISGGGDESLVQRAMAQGASKVLIKPFSMSELSTAVSEVMEDDNISAGQEKPNA